MKHPNQNQSGITLLVAIVLLAAVTFISFSVSTIVIREIQSGRLTLRSEPAISAANSGGEVGLYRLFREVGGIDATESLPGGSVTFQVTSDLYDDFFSFLAPVGEETLVLLYDAANTENLSADFGSATIQMDSDSGTVTYKIYSWGDVETLICSGTLSGGSISLACALDMADDRYIIAIQPTGTTAGSGKVTATNNAGAPRGIPSNSPKLDVTGTNGPVQRRIEINL